MRDLESYPKVYLQTGDCFLGVQPTLVTTVLGSCVAVTMCAPHRAIGAICHAFLPDSKSFGAHGGDPQVCRYVDTALESMLASFTRLKITPVELVVKVFGGSSGLVRGESGPLYDIGGRNLRAVHARLDARGLRVATQATGGSRGRKLLFLTHTGDVWVKLLNNASKENRP